MIQLKYDASLMKYFSIFEDITKIAAKDCFSINNTLIFFVDQGMAKIAVGKNGNNIKKLNSMLNKEIKVIEFSKDVEQLVRNIIFPLKAESIELSEDEENGKVIKIKFKFSKERRVLLDNDQKKLKLLKEIVNRYYNNINNIRVLQL